MKLDGFCIYNEIVYDRPSGKLDTVGAPFGSTEIIARGDACITFIHPYGTPYRSTTYSKPRDATPEQGQRKVETNVDGCITKFCKYGYTYSGTCASEEANNTHKCREN